MFKEYHVYILHCSDGTYYTGMTSNLENRMIQHNEAEFPKAYTARRRPLKLEFVATFSSVFDAIELLLWMNVHVDHMYYDIHYAYRLLSYSCMNQRRNLI